MFVKRSINCLGTSVKLILYIKLLISSKDSVYMKYLGNLYNLRTSVLNLLNVIIFK